MRPLLLLLLLPTVASADDFASWKVPDGLSTNPAKCDRGDVTECLHLGWDAEAGSRGMDDSNHVRLTNARDWFQKACKSAKHATCPNADRIQAKLAKVDAMKDEADKDRFYCGDALDGGKLRVAGSKTQGTLVIMDCLPLVSGDFHEGLRGMAKMTMAQKQEHVLQAALDGLCPSLTPKPAACAVKAKGLSTAKQKEASSEILGAAFGGELAKRGGELDGYFVVN